MTENETLAYIIEDVISAQLFHVVKIVRRACGDHLVAGPMIVSIYTIVLKFHVNLQLRELNRKRTSCCASTVDQYRLFVLSGSRIRPVELQDVIQSISG